MTVMNLMHDVENVYGDGDGVGDDDESAFDVSVDNDDDVDSYNRRCPW